MIAELPLFVFTTFSGAAAGAYFMSLFFGKDFLKGKVAWAFPLVVLALLGVGLCGTLLHLGQPLRFLNALSRPGAPIALEGYCSMFFGIFVLIDVALTKVNGSTPAAIRMLGALGAIALMLVTGTAYAGCHAIPLWATFATYPLYLVGDVVMGVSLLGLFSPNLVEKASFRSAVFVVAAQWAFTMVLEVVNFSSCGLAVTAPAISLVMASVGSVVMVLPSVVRAMKPKPAAICLAVLAVAGVAIVRYAVYAL